MANFQQALAYTLMNEGGYSEDKDDRGGATKFGVTIATLSTYLGGQATIQEVRNLSKDDAANIYYHLYWTPLCLSMVNNNSLATSIFDVGVNCGVHYSARITQSSLNALDLTVIVDGEMGFKTCEKLNQVDQGKFILTFENLLVEHYYGIVAANPKQQKFLPGWLARAGRLLSLK